MIKIQPLTLSLMAQVRALCHDVNPGGSHPTNRDATQLKAMAGLSGPNLTVCLAQWTSRCLAVHDRRNTLYYVAVDADKVLGLIGLSQDGFDNRRWWLSPIVIDPSESTYDIGSQLVQYIVNLYGGEGVQSFVAPALADDSPTQGLLKAAGFRSCTRLWQYQLPSLAQAAEYLDNAPKSTIRLIEARSHHNYAISQVYNDALPPTVRISLGRSPKDFAIPLAHKLTQQLKGHFAKGWVWHDAARDTVYGYVSLTSTNFMDYTLLVVTSPGRTDGYDALVRFGLTQIRQSSQSARVVVSVLDGQEELQHALDAAGFQATMPRHLLVKDYWVPLSPAAKILQNPLLLLEGQTSPA
jgi:hypothetical protein